MNGRKEGKAINTNFQASVIVQNVLHISANIYNETKLNQTPPPALNNRILYKK